MRRLATMAAIVVATTLSVTGPAAAVPGNGAKADTLTINCGGTDYTVVTSFPFHAFGAAHILESNKPGPLVSFSYEILDGGQIVDSGVIGHKNTHRGQPLETCTGSTVLAPDLVMEFEVISFFPAGK